MSPRGIFVAGHQVSRTEEVRGGVGGRQSRRIRGHYSLAVLLVSQRTRRRSWLGLQHNLFLLRIHDHGRAAGTPRRIERVVFGNVTREGCAIPRLQRGRCYGRRPVWAPLATAGIPRHTDASALASPVSTRHPFYSQKSAVHLCAGGCCNCHGTPSLRASDSRPSLIGRRDHWATQPVSPR